MSPAAPPDASVASPVPAVAPQLGLAPASEPDPAVVAMVATAVWEVWPRPAEAVAAAPKDSAWRFSGRWWARPVPMRRARPAGR